MNLKKELQTNIQSRGADFVHFVDISGLPAQQNKHFPTAILMGIILSAEYLKEVTQTEDYVKKMIRDKQIHNDEFHLTEKQTDALADFTAGFLVGKGFAAYSQSEDNVYLTGFYDLKNNRTPLPHKTISLMAGLGWIGKHDLLVTRQFGSAVSMCSVLTDAPLETVVFPPPESSCGNCRVCVDVCSDGALKGKNWEPGIAREELIDITRCTPCLKCLTFCPWTQKYIGENSKSTTGFQPKKPRCI